MRPTAVALVCAGSIAALSAQSAAPRPAAQIPRPAFEVASVKPNRSGTPFVSIGLQPGGRYTATNVPLKLLITNAYGVEDFQIIDAPSWLDEERFDIVAKAEGEVAPSMPGGPPGPVQLMLQTLLEDRFRLALHQETRELPVYALTTVHSDRKLGPGMQPSSTPCAAGRGPAGAPGRFGAPPPASASAPERPQCGMRMMPGRISAGSVAIPQLLRIFSMLSHRIVLDRTGLDGTFDLDLAFTPDRLPGPPPPGAPPLPPVDPNGPSLFTALQEQLGLKLESTRAPVQVMVIDHVERPESD